MGKYNLLGVLGLEDKLSPTMRSALGFTRQLNQQVLQLDRSLQALGRQKPTVKVSLGGTAQQDLSRLEQRLNHLGAGAKTIKAPTAKVAAALMEPMAGGQSAKVIQMAEARQRKAVDGTTDYTRTKTTQMYSQLFDQLDAQEKEHAQKQSFYDRLFGHGGVQDTQEAKLIKRQEASQATFQKRAQAFLTRQTNAEARVAQQQLTAQTRAEQQVEAAQKRQRQQQVRANTMADHNATSVVNKIGAGISQVGKGFMNAVSTVGSLAYKVISAPFKLLGSLPGMLGLAGGAYGLFGLVKGSLDFSANMEQAKIGFTTMLGDAKKASSFVNDLFQFAAVTPFEFPQVQKAGRTWLAMGFKPEEIIPDLTAVGNAVSALGGDQDVLDRVVMSIGQIRTTGKVSARELRELALAGIPVYDILAKKLGLSQQAIMSIGNEGIASQKALDALFAGLNERFAGGMALQSRSWTGLWSTIKDYSMMTLGALGDGIRGKLQPALSKLTDWFTQNPEKVKKWRDELSSFGYSASKSLVDAFQGAVDRVNQLLGTPRWENADLFGKVSLAWDVIIAEPFADWWNGRGKTKVTAVARDMGAFLGGTIAGAVSAAFGLGNQGSMVNAGVTAGGAFVQGFISEIEKVDWGAVWGNAFKKHPVATSAITAGGANWVTGGLLGAGLGGLLKWGGKALLKKLFPVAFAGTTGEATAAEAAAGGAAAGGTAGVGSALAGWAGVAPGATLGMGGATATGLLGLAATLGGIVGRYVVGPATSKVFNWTSAHLPWGEQYQAEQRRKQQDLFNQMRNTPATFQARGKPVVASPDYGGAGTGGEVRLGMGELRRSEAELSTRKELTVNLNLAITRADTPDDEALAKRTADHLFGQLKELFENS